MEPPTLKVKNRSVAVGHISGALHSQFDPSLCKMPRVSGDNCRNLKQSDILRDSEKPD